jgi:sugar phosphate isomerase/epimerase
MRRRKFLKTSLGALLAAQADLSIAAAWIVPSPAAGPAPGLQASADAGAAPPGKLKIDAYSRFLQWLRTPDEVAGVIRELGFEGLDLTVRPFPGHVDPARVRQDLPPFVNALRKHGITVSAITCPITDADSPYAEDILSTASGLGITHYWWGTFRYNLSQPILPQLEALRPRVEKLAQLNRKYKMTAMYHTYTSPATVGCVMWDLLYLLRDFDPKLVGIHYDTSHMVNAQLLGGWETSLRAAGAYIQGVSVKDSIIEKREGTERTSASQQALRPVPARGRGRGDSASMPDWRESYTPLGQGNVPLRQFVQILKDIRFSGPMEIQLEYPAGGAESGSDKLTLPREQVLALIKKDLDTLREVLRAAGLGE